MRRRDHVDRVPLNETEVANHGQNGFTRWTSRHLAGKMLLRYSQTPYAFQGRRDRRLTQRVWPPASRLLSYPDCRRDTPVARRYTVMTIFARGCPSPRYRIASGTSRNGKDRSMIGVTFPASMSCLRATRSALLCFDEGDQLLPPEARHHGSQEEGQDRWLLAA